MNNDALINQTSGNFDYYTPEDIIALVSEVLGEIDLDPASCDIANKTVKATTYFTKEQDGLTQPWFGRVFMNHPFHKGEKKCSPNCTKKTCPKRGYCITEDIPSNFDWISKLESEYNSGNVSEAICITFSSMSEAWMNPLLNQIQCFVKGRVHYRKPNGEVLNSATKGSLLTYFGPNKEKFKTVFSKIGVVK